MSDPVRLVVMQRIAQRLEELTVARGYNKNIGHKVYLARRSFDEEDVPALSLFDGVDENEKDAYGGVLSMMPVDINVHDLVASDHVEHINRLYADLRSVMEADITLEGVAENIELIGGGPSYPDDGSDVVSLLVSYAVSFRTRRGDPYTVMEV